ncbi:MAG: AEC family transporter [Deltaproteobacteria bacterium]|nr:AEC family transporter [Candidatus Deferrimicrobiaceae bacterium]
MDILQSVFPVFFVIAIGAAARRYRFLDEPFVQKANALVYYLLLPALLFYEIGRSDLRQAFNGQLVAGGYAATLAVFLLAFFFSRRLGLSPGERGAFIQGSFRANLAYVGLPIVLSAVGSEGLRTAGIFLGLIVPLLNTLAIMALVLPHEEGKRGGGWKSTRQISGQILKNPIILSCFLGIGWSLFRLPFTGIFGKTLAILSSATLPLSLLCLGGSFSFQRARSGFRLAALASGMKIVLLTAIGIAAYRWMGLGGDDLRIGAIMLGCPTAVITYVMASQLKGDPDLAGTIVIVSTAASAFTITGWLFFLRAMGW